MSDKLTSEKVAHVAHLARLDLNSAELATYTDQLAAIIDYFSQLENIKTDDIQPVAQTTGLVNILAEDEIQADQVDKQAFLDGAPAAQPPYLKVKAVLE